MILFYTTKVHSGNAVLENDELRHCIKVLRKKPGDIIHITNGEGSYFKGVLRDFDKSKAIVKLEEEFVYDRILPSLHIAISPTKNFSRFEWFLEKAVELGVTEITPIFCKRTERKKINTERAKKILISAMKQSFRFQQVVFNPLTDIHEFLLNLNVLETFIGHYRENNPWFIEELNPKRNTVILIGPEGDFTNEELEFATRNKVKMANLSVNRLRTETAGIVACSQFVSSQINIFPKLIKKL